MSKGPAGNGGPLRVVRPPDSATGRAAFERYAAGVPYILRSPARPRPTAPDYEDHEPLELIGTADTYEEAYAQLEAQLPADWVLVGIDRYLEDNG